MTPQTFDARVGAATPLDLAVSKRGAWPDPPQRYVIPYAFRLADPTDVREGVSGSVIAYEGGVLGLAHFAREAKGSYQRELYLVPLSAWAEGWEELDMLIEPLIDEDLRNAATARRVRDVKVGIIDLSTDRAPDLVIAGYRPDAYAERPRQAESAQRALVGGGVLIVGRPKSGKTRLAWELIRQFPDAVLVVPHAPHPPARFETAGLSARTIVVLCDDLHDVAVQFQPLFWCDRLSTAAAAVYLIATVRDGRDWARVRDHQRRLVDAIGEAACPFVSLGSEGGEDLPRDLGMRLAMQLGLSEAEFDQRFDGTPGSLTLDLRDMRVRYQRLRDEQLGGVAASRLLDSLKLLHVGGQSDFDQQIVRAVAEKVRGDGSIAAETWEGICRRTREEGFGGFSEVFSATFR